MQQQFPHPQHQLVHQEARPATIRINRVMEPAQFDQVVAAIAGHKYSWACVLILQFAGYNPLQYIPYRTYNRIVKDNHPRRQRQHLGEVTNGDSSPMLLQELGFEQDLEARDRQIQGGWFSSGWSWL